MMNSEQDKDAAIRTYTGNPKFRDLLKKILGGSDTRKRVDNFLDTQDQMMAQNFNNPAGLPQDLYEATMRQYGRKEFGDYTTDDMKLIIEAQKNKGLVWQMFSKQYRERYKDALKLQRWPLVDTAKMEKEKKEKARQARLRRLYGLKDDEQLKT